MTMNKDVVPAMAVKAAHPRPFRFGPVVVGRVSLAFEIGGDNSVGGELYLAELKGNSTMEPARPVGLVGEEPVLPRLATLSVI